MVVLCVDFNGSFGSRYVAAEALDSWNEMRVGDL
jgi:hypothetical protein